MSAINRDRTIHKDLRVMSATWMRVIAFLLGCTCCTDLIYIGKIGNTTITVGMGIAAIACFLFVLQYKMIFPPFVSIRGSVANWLIVFFGLIVFSAAPTLMYFGVASVSLRYIYGVVNLVGYMLVTIATVQYSAFEREMIAGIVIGFILNLAFSVIAYIQFTPNVPVPIYRYLVSMFPQGSVQMKMWTFRAQGLFKESSYFIGYIIIIFWLLWGRIRETYKIILLFILVAGIVAFSGSGNILVFFATFVLMAIVTPKRHAKSIFHVNIDTFFVCFFLVLFFAIYFLFGGSVDFIAGGLSNTLEGASIEQSSERFDNISNAVSMIPELPVGCGWNMINSYNQLYHTERLTGTNAAYASGTSSFLLTLALEIGTLGVLAYLGFFYSLYKGLMKQRKRNFSTGIAGALVATLLLQTVNGVAFFSHFMLVVGLAISKACMVNAE